MKEFIGIISGNIIGFDGMIIVIALVNYFFVFNKVRTEVNRIYHHFNGHDYLKNLSKDAKEAIKKNTKEPEKLTAGDLLKYREKMNRWYAFYTNITTLFPLLGMLGTVVSLIPMVKAIGSESTGLFFSALTSTFWGIVCAMIFKLLDATISYKIDDIEKHMEYMFNPGRKTA